ncbi:MAG: hypothetical protein IJN67_11725 [Oscillospiraceae bacterium]|nr:hypothetical protein [Oscillospiraceae bacterium]
MFKLSSVKPRYFEFEAPDNLKVLHIEPPKLKTLKRMNDLVTGGHAGIEETVAIAARILNKNREKRRITADMVMDWMDASQLTAFIKAFILWVSDEKQNDPN